MFHQEVTIGDGVEAVAADRRKTQQLGDVFAVQRVGRAGQGAGAERQHVRPSVRVTQSTGVTLEHLGVGQQVVPEQHRLGALQMGIARHDRLAVLLARLDQRRLQLDDARHPFDQRGAHEQPRIGGYLVIATARGVQPPGRLADPLAEGCLHQAVDVLEGAIEWWRIAQQAKQASHQRGGVSA